MDELCRLGLAALSEDGNTVSLLNDRFVPHDDEPRLFGFLGANVGDHLSAASTNVLQRDRRHFEQALFTDELSAESAESLRSLAQTLWATLAATAVPALEKLMADDQAAGRPARSRGRIGLFSYHESLQENDDEQSKPPRD